MRFRARAVVPLAILLALALPSPARALSPPVSGATLLAFGAAYDAGGRTTTHRGIDLACAAGDTVRSPCEGRVSFAGRVPGDDGATVLAVTLETPDGLRFTLLPLERTAVGAGDTVSDGEPVGQVAAAGDGSCAETHVHLSARRGELYLDPATLLAAPPVESPAVETPAQPVEPAPSPPPPAAPIRATSAVPSVRPAGSAPVVPSAARAPEGSTAPRTQTARTDARVAAASPQGVAEEAPGAPGAASPPPAGRRVDAGGGDVTWALAAAAAACALGGACIKGTALIARPGESGVT